MLDIEFRFLKYIQETQPVAYTDLLNGFCAANNIGYTVCDDILQCLLEDRLLVSSGEISDRHSASYRLPSRTTQILYQYEQERSDKAHHEYLQCKFAKIGARAAVFGAIAGAITGALLTFFLTLFFHSPH